MSEQAQLSSCCQAAPGSKKKIPAVPEFFLEDGDDFLGLSAQLNSSGIGPGNLQGHQSPLFIS